MLSRRCRIEDLDPVQWKRLSDLGLKARSPRTLFLVHERGRVLRCHDSEGGDRPVPFERVEDPRAAAEALLESVRGEGFARAWVLEPDAFHAALARAQSACDPAAPMTAHLAAEWAARFSADGCAVAPAADFLFYGLPWARLERFAERMLPPSCVYVLGVFDGDALWATLFAQIEAGQIVGLSTSAALSPEDVADVVGRDQHPFLLAAVANRYRRPAFGWFCSRADFEAYLLAPTVEGKDRVFQEALMGGRANFDFNALIDRGMTALGPINPGEAAIIGADREANPRTRTPEAPGPEGAAD